MTTVEFRLIVRAHSHWVLVNQRVVRDDNSRYESRETSNRETILQIFDKVRKLVSNAVILQRAFKSIRVVRSDKHIINERVFWERVRQW